MRVTVAGVELRSPIIAASGTFSYGVEVRRHRLTRPHRRLRRKGPLPRAHGWKPTPCIIETAAGMINAIGLQNMGVRPFIAEKLPKLQHIKDVVVIANVFGFTIEDCLEVISALNDASGIVMYELNASCPNTSHGGMVFGTDPALLYELVARCKGVSRRPLMVKLSPNVTSIGQMARVAADAGADAVSSSTPSSPSPSTPKQDAPASPTSPVASPAPPSNPSPSAWSTTYSVPSASLS